MDRQNAIYRIKFLQPEGKTGKEIAESLWAEGYSIQVAQEAFYDLRYVASIEQFTADIPELFVSDNPERAGIAAAIWSLLPETLPSVVWWPLSPERDAQ